jgi:hypothetical protein
MTSGRGIYLECMHHRRRAFRAGPKPGGVPGRRWWNGPIAAASRSPAREPRGRHEFLRRPSLRRARQANRRYTVLPTMAGHDLSHVIESDGKAMAGAVLSPLPRPSGGQIEMTVRRRRIRAETCFPASGRDALGIPPDRLGNDGGAGDAPLFGPFLRGKNNRRHRFWVTPRFAAA